MVEDREKADVSWTSGSQFRDAEIEDAECLAELCRRAFPARLKWHGPSQGPIRWWREMIERPSSETAVLSDRGSVVGFVLIVFDEAQFKRDRAAAERSPLERLVAAFLAPATAWAEFRGERWPVQTSFDPERVLAPIVAPENRTWLELVAVDPDHAGRGHGGRLMQEIETRTAASGRRAVGLAVESNNARARHLYERIGYQPTRIGTATINYVKILSS